MSFYLDCIKKIFSEDGILVKKYNMEFRPQQERLAIEFAKDLEAGNRHTLAEAGTGVGKSLAYLLPGIIWAKFTNRKFVVSTHTKNLQDQLVKKEIPFCQDILKSDIDLFQFSGFKHVVMVGKANYLCTNRLDDAIMRYSKYESEDDTIYTLNTIKSIVKSNKNFDGLRDHLGIYIPDALWSEINADSSMCNIFKCTNTDCYHALSKAKIAAADIVIVNHSLIFSTVASGGNESVSSSKGVLFDNDFVVFDEGHKIIEVATDFFGDEASEHSIDIIIHQIVSACKKGFPFENLNVEFIKDACDNIKSKVATMFKSIDKKYFKNKDEKFYRIKVEKSFTNMSSEAINSLKRHLENEMNKTGAFGDTKCMGNDIIKRLTNFNDFINDTINMDNPTYVYWFEKDLNNKIKLVAKPIDVAAYLDHFIFSRNVNVGVISATLTDSRKNMDRFKLQSGIEGLDEKHDITEIIESSPFDYDSNMEVYVSKDCPEFSYTDNKNNLVYNAKVIYHCANSLINGGTLVLCTSYTQCKKLGNKIKEIFDGIKNVYIQGEEYSRDEMINRFKKDGDAIMFGVSSFWTGVDIPGNALSQLIILKMPFASPTYPLLEAKGEIVEENGGNPFIELFVPDAVIQFRQGIGRLIRSAKDKGRVVITDTRLISKFYGKEFFNVMPTNNRTIFDLNNYTKKIKLLEIEK